MKKFPENEKILCSYEGLAKFQRHIRDVCSECEKEVISDIEFYILKNHEACKTDFFYIIRTHNGDGAEERNFNIGGVKMFDFLFLQQVITDIFLYYPNATTSISFNHICKD